MSVQDIIKKSFLNQFNTDLTTAQILLVLALAAIVGIYIFFVYRLVCRKAFYSKGFAISLTVIAMITASIILTIQSSVVISLGMVGALSIVRFRTAIKDPMDLAFLFWAISIGIMCGASMFEVAVEASLIITVVMLALHFVPNPVAMKLLLINGNIAEDEDAIYDCIKNNTKFYKVKSKNVTKSNIDMIIEIKPNDEKLLIDELNKFSTVNNIVIMSHDGEVTY